MKLYEEAINELNHELSVGNIGIITRDNIIKALERAKKEHELLGLYRKAHPRVSVFNPYYDELVKKENELEEMK